MQHSLSIAGTADMSADEDSDYSVGEISLVSDHMSG